jgi:hypothetical protein
MTKECRKQGRAVPSLRGPPGPIWRCLVVKRDVRGAFAKTSLRGRLAAGLWCFERYCHVVGCLDPEIDEYLSWMWEFVSLGCGVERFEQWSCRRPVLVETGLGYEMPNSVLSCIQTRHLSLEEFQALLCSVTEILFSSLYSDPQNELSMRFLAETIELCRPYRIYPPAEVFAMSEWLRAGWGAPLTEQQVVEWRSTVRGW